MLCIKRRGGGMDQRPWSNMPLQLLWSRGHKNNNKRPLGPKIAHLDQLVQMPWSPHQNNFSFFFIYRSPWYFLSSLKSIAGNLWVQKKVKNRFSGWLLWQPSWIYNLNILTNFGLHQNSFYEVSNQLYFQFRSRSSIQIFKMAVVAANIDFWQKQFQLFLIYKPPWYFLPCFQSTGISIQEMKFKIDFQKMTGHLRFWIQTILAIFNPQVTSVLPTKFWVNWPFR